MVSRAAIAGGGGGGGGGFFRGQGGWGGYCTNGLARLSLLVNSVGFLRLYTAQCSGLTFLAKCLV